MKKTSTRLTLSTYHSTYSILTDEILTLEEVIEQMVAPILLAAGYDLDAVYDVLNLDANGLVMEDCNDNNRMSSDGEVQDQGMVSDEQEEPRQCRC